MTELKSCPFCGGEAAHFALNEAVFKATWVSHVTHCTKCQARVQSLNSEASIILWNTRANPSTEPVAWRFRLKDDWKFSGDNPDTWPNKHLRENAEIEPLYATPTPEGDFVLVPREPTHEMLKAGARTWLEAETWQPSKIYKAMIAAAPNPPRSTQ